MFYLARVHQTDASASMGTDLMAILDRTATEPPVMDSEFAELRRRVFRRDPHVVWTTIRGETVVFHVDRGKYESLNEVATSVWELLVDGATFDRISDAMQEQYELLSGEAVTQMRRDVAALLGTLKKARVIVSEPLV